MRYLQMVLEGEELARPEIRSHFYRSAPTAYKHVLQPVDLRLWVSPLRELYGTIPGDWSEAGFDAPPTGMTNLALLDSGETADVLHDIGTEAYYIVINGRVFRATHWLVMLQTPCWPWRIVPWSDRLAVNQLLGETLCIWPRKHDGYWDGFSEPVRVVAAYASTSDNRYGLGVVPCLEGGPDPAELGAVGLDPDVWPLRRLSDISASLSVREIGLTHELRPPIVLWGPRTANRPLLYTQEPKSLLPAWTMSEGINNTYKEFRLLLADKAGTSPALWTDEEIPASWRARSPAEVLVARQDVRFCVECAAQGLPHVPIVHKGRALCIRHYAAFRASVKNAVTPARDAVGSAFKRNPVLSFTPVTKDASLTGQTVSPVLGLRRGVDDSE